MLTLVAICLGPILNTVAQKRSSAPSKPKENINVYFIVTIKGHGLYAKKGTMIDWSIDRSYSGVVPLALGQTITSGGKTRQSWGVFDRNGPSEYPIHVEIKDSVIYTVKSRGEGRSFENTRTTTTFDGVGLANGRSAQLVIHGSSGLYDLEIPILGDPISFDVLAISVQDIERSDFGYGDLPTHETLLLFKKRFDLNAYVMPTLAGLLEGGIMKHEKMRLASGDGQTEFDSGDIYAGASMGFAVSPIDIDTKDSPLEQPNTMIVSVRYNFKKVLSK